MIMDLKVGYFVVETKGVGQELRLTYVCGSEERMYGQE